MNIRYLLSKKHNTYRNSFLSQVETVKDAIEDVFDRSGLDYEVKSALKDLVTANVQNRVYSDHYLINGNLFRVSIEWLNSGLWHTQLNETYFIAE